MSDDTGARSGSCAIIGRPNVGKSTLLNALLGQKLAIATARPQTTRTNLLGVYTQEDPATQIAFTDTPGLHRPKNALGRAIVESAKASVSDTDAVLMLTDVGPRSRVEFFLQGEDAEVLALAREANVPVVLAINKVDRMKKKALLLPFLERSPKVHDFAAVVPVSAERGTNLKQLVSELRRLLPEGLNYDPELLTNRSERFFAAEMVREAAMRHTRQEVPYAVAVKIDSYEEDGQLIRVAATVVVAKEAHKGIVIGKGGLRLKQIGTEAREQLEEMLQRKVFLELWVKVQPSWTDDPNKVRELTHENGAS